MNALSKSLGLALVFLFSLSFTTSAWAGGALPPETAHELRNSVNSAISYPEFLKDYKLEKTSVTVHFVMEENNRPKLVSVETDLPALRRHVEQEFNKVNLSGLGDLSGRKFSMTIVFQLL